MSSNAQIKHMVSRFLSWKLPENFNPDGGISFKREFNEHTAHPMKHEPTGTNLLDATQAEAMVRHMLSGLPDVSDIIEVLHQCEDYFDNRADADCDQDGFVPNKEMTLLSVVREAISNAERQAVIINNNHVHPVFQQILASISRPGPSNNG